MDGKPTCLRSVAGNRRVQIVPQGGYLTEIDCVLYRSQFCDHPFAGDSTGEQTINFVLKNLTAG